MQIPHPPTDIRVPHTVKYKLYYKQVIPLALPADISAGVCPSCTMPASIAYITRVECFSASHRLHA